MNSEDDEAKVFDYLNKYNLLGERFTKNERRLGKTPDFRVKAGLDLAFFCEVKSIAEDKFVEGGRNDPIPNRLTGDIHEATKQFDAVNSKVEYPNVLAFVNHDDLCRFQDLYDVITGNPIAVDDKFYLLWSKFSEGRIKDEKTRIHLFLWFNENGSVRLLFNATTSVFHLKLCRWFNVDPKNIKPFRT